MKHVISNSIKVSIYLGVLRFLQLIQKIGPIQLEKVSFQNIFSTELLKQCHNYEFKRI